MALRDEILEAFYDSLPGGRDNFNHVLFEHLADVAARTARPAVVDVRRERNRIWHAREDLLLAVRRFSRRTVKGPAGVPVYLSRALNRYDEALAEQT